MAGRDWFDAVVGFASALNTLVLLVLTVVLVPAALSFTRSMRQLGALLDRVYDDIKPLAEHANRIAASVDDITDSIRAEVKGVSETIAEANQGLHRAVESTEQRIRKFGALVDVAQQEAERAFVSTAAAVEGVRAGASAAVRREKPESDGTTQARPPRPRVRTRRKRPE